MIRITYELYANDYIRKENLTKTFSSIDDMHEWILDNYILDTSSSLDSVYYPCGDRCGRIQFASTKLKTFVGFRCCDVWIHMIEDDRGIIFSDGKYTDRQQHKSKFLNEYFEKWSKEDNAKKKYNFVE